MTLNSDNIWPENVVEFLNENQQNFEGIGSMSANSYNDRSNTIPSEETIGTKEILIVETLLVNGRFFYVPTNILMYINV